MLGWVVSSFAKFVVIKLSSCNQAWQIIHLQIYIYIYIYLFIYLAAGDLYTFFWAAGLVLDTHLSFIVSFSNANIWSTKYENHSLEILDDPLMILFQAISIKSYSKITFLLTVHTCPPVVPWQISPLKWGKTAWQ